MGYRASPLLDKGALYLNTKSVKNGKSFCKPSYQVSLFSGDNANLRAKGKVEVYFQSETGLRSSTEILDDSSTVFSSFSNSTFLIGINDALSSSEISSMFVSYERSFESLDWFNYAPIWRFDSVNVYFGDSQTHARFCLVDHLFLNSRKKNSFSMFQLCL